MRYYLQFVLFLFYFETNQGQENPLHAQRNNIFIERDTLIQHNICYKYATRMKPRYDNKTQEEVEKMIGKGVNETHRNLCDVERLGECIHDLTTNFLFWHIPKNGGTTMKDAFSEIFKLPYAMVPYEEKHCISSAKKLLKTMQPHFALGANFQALMQVPDPFSPVVLMTLFRDPIESRKSLFLYRMSPPPSEKFKVNHGIKTIREWLQLRFKQTYYTATNYNCASLCGIHQMFGHLLTEKHLTYAKAVVSKMFPFLLTDLEESIKMMSHFFGWELKGKLSILPENKSKKLYNITDEEMKMLQEANWCDVELYEHAQVHYQKMKSFYNQNRALVNT